jgi:O-antigen/teichoic acid export membrane protein
MTAELKTKILSYTAANISAQVATTLTGVFLARTLPLEELGTYRQVILLTNTVSGLLSLGLPLSLFYFLPRLEDRREKSRFAVQTLVILTVIGILSAIGALVLNTYIALRFNNPRLEQVLPYAAPLFLTGILIKYLAPLLLSLDRARLAGVFRVIQAFSVSSVLVLLVALGEPLRWALFAMACAEGLSLLLGLWIQHRLLPLAGWGSGPLLRQQLIYALPLGLSGMIGLLSRQVDQFMISMYMDPERFALYSVGATEVPIVPLLLRSAGSVILPQMAGFWAAKDFQSFSDLFSATQRKLSLVCIPVTVVFIALAKPFLIFLYGDVFEASAGVFRIYGLIQLNRLFLFGILLQAMGHTRMLLMGEIAFMIMNIIGNWLLLRWVGFMGPAIATELAGIVIMVFYTWQIGRKSPLSRREFYRTGDLMPFLFASTVAAVAAWLVSLVTQPPMLALLSGGTLFVVVYVGVLLLTGSLQENEIRWLDPRRWRRFLP